MGNVNLCLVLKTQVNETNIKIVYWNVCIIVNL